LRGAEIDWWVGQSIEEVLGVLWKH
jgi:hypothetical protein